MSNITNEDLDKKLTEIRDDFTTQIKDIRLSVYGPRGKENEGLNMRVHDLERVIKIQVRLSWVILTAIVIAGITNIMNKVQIVW